MNSDEIHSTSLFEYIPWTIITTCLHLSVYLHLKELEHRTVGWKVLILKYDLG